MDKKEIIIRSFKVGCKIVGDYACGIYIGYNLNKLFHTMRIRKEMRLHMEALTNKELRVCYYEYCRVEDPDGSLRRAFLAKKKSKGATEEEISRMREILFRGCKASRES